MFGLKGSSTFETSTPRHCRLLRIIEAQARLAGFEVGTNSVKCKLGLSPVAQLAPTTVKLERPAGAIKKTIERARNALQRRLRPLRMGKFGHHAKRIFVASRPITTLLSF